MGNELRVNDNTENMYFKIPQTLKYLNKFVTLKPLDMILTGTPRFLVDEPILKDGDLVKAKLTENEKTLSECQWLCTN